MSVIRDVWPENTELEIPIKRRRINLAYEDVDKIFLSFKFESNSNYFLHSSQPIKINDSFIVIPDLPQNPLLLTLVEKSDIDVSNLVKVSKEGEYNIVQVNVVESRKGWWPSRHVGTLHLYFKIVLREKNVSTRDNTKFCMHCGRNIEENVIYCPFCGLTAPPGGTSYKECRNCVPPTLLPPIAKYCNECGSMQPDL
jgi:RNA polymerase subunit RPABC4/transcription elongation factor Spt4